MREEVFPLITNMVGQPPVSFDVAQVGSYAHRLRAYWSNLFQNHQFNTIMAKVERPQGRFVSTILLQEAWKPREVATTYRMLIRSDDVSGRGESREVNLDEKARAMGYNADELRKNDKLDDEKLAEVQSRRAQAMAAERIAKSSSYTQHLAQSISHQDWEHRLQKMHMHRTHFVKESVAPAVVAGAIPEWKSAKREKGMRLPTLGDTVRLTQSVANVVEQEASRERFLDMHEGEWCLKWLKARGAVALPEEDAHRIKRRARRHRWDEATDEVYLITYGGKELRVPKPDDRMELVRAYRAKTDHWGIRRTMNLLWQRHFWVGLKSDVRAVVTQCETCQRVKTHYVCQRGDCAHPAGDQVLHIIV
ncbi:hypothetical protein CYMTET_26619 [Cymbomonas tetramitiformis]|uniref:Integrase zinc-binding domain-containing protein n=1 Tax=Cymbomonas tetramitiformis TaxID=36881 RepID=A0AAE0FRE3_9CHLO|nr:hypothetical protein CYMTET_26619 [Cymbomonas tetramitiformis]